jgi:hypothetical protein
MAPEKSRVRTDSSIEGAESIPVMKSTYSEISERVGQLREVLAKRNVRFHRDSALGKLLREAESLAMEWDAGNQNQEFRRLLNAAHANRIAEAILSVRDDPNSQQCLARIAGNDMNLSGRAISQGKDHLWELDLIYALRRHGFSAELVDPPDIVVDLAGAPFPIACKKVYSEKGVQAQMRKGVDQLKGQGGAGLVALNIDDLVPNGTILASASRAQASDFLAKFNSDFVERHRLVLQRFVKEGRCDGVLASTATLADLRDSKPRFNLITETTLWTLDSIGPEAAARFAELREKLPSYAA